MPHVWQIKARSVHKPLSIGTHATDLRHPEPAPGKPPPTSICQTCAVFARPPAAAEKAARKEPVRATRVTGRLTESLTPAVVGGWKTDPVTTRSQQTQMRRWFPFFLAALIAALAAILLGTTSSASAATSAETRVGAINAAAEPLVEPPQHIAAGQGRDATQNRPGIVVATGVATKSGDELLQGEQYVYRVHGGGSGPWGHSWTPENPMGMANPRSELGLPK